MEKNFVIQKELDVDLAQKSFKSGNPLTMDVVADFEKYSISVETIKSILPYVCVVSKSALEHNILENLVGKEFYDSWRAKFDGDDSYTYLYSTKKLLENGCFSILADLGEYKILFEYGQYDLLLERHKFEFLGNKGKWDMVYNYFISNKETADWRTFKESKEGMDYLLGQKDFRHFAEGSRYAKNTAKKYEGNGYTITEILKVLKANGASYDEAEIVCTGEILEIVGLTQVSQRGLLDSWLKAKEIRQANLDKALKNETWKIRNKVYFKAFLVGKRNKFLLKHGCLLYVLINYLKEVFSSLKYMIGFILWGGAFFFCKNAHVEGETYECIMGCFLCALVFTSLSDVEYLIQRLGFAFAVLSLIFLEGFPGVLLALICLCFGIYGMLKNDI